MNISIKATTLARSMGIEVIETNNSCDVCGKELYLENMCWVCEDDDLHNKEEIK